MLQEDAADVAEGREGRHGEEVSTGEQEIRCLWSRTSIWSEKQKQGEGLGLKLIQMFFPKNVHFYINIQQNMNLSCWTLNNLFVPFTSKKLSTYSFISWWSHGSSCPTLSAKPSTSETSRTRQVSSTVLPGRSWRLTSPETRSAAGTGVCGSSGSSRLLSFLWNSS